MASRCDKFKHLRFLCKQHLQLKIIGYHIDGVMVQYGRPCVQAQVGSNKRLNKLVCVATPLSKQQKGAFSKTGWL